VTVFEFLRAAHKPGMSEAALDDLFFLAYDYHLDSVVLRCLVRRIEDDRKAER
jgi:hypothetical protein